MLKHFKIFDKIVFNTTEIRLGIKVYINTTLQLNS